MRNVELFSYEACPYAQRTRMALLEKGIPFSLTEVDLYNKPDWFKALSPYGKVPLLRDGDALIYESHIINEYLEDAFPERPLLPADPAARARARIWIDYCDSLLMPALHALIADRRNPEKQIKNRQVVRDRLLFLEHEGLRKLSEGPYWLGAELSLVDLQFTPFFERFPCYVELWEAPLPAECYRLLAWIDLMRTRDSHQRTAQTHEFHMSRYRRYDQAA